jgi:hypothetical protein
MWEDNIKMDRREMGWTELTQNRVDGYFISTVVTGHGMINKEIPSNVE